MTVHDLVNAVTSGNFDSQLRRLRGSGELEYLRRRAQLISAAESFSKKHPLRREIRVFFAPKNPDICLKFGDLRLSAAPDPSVTVIAQFHGEPVISLTAGERDGTLDLTSGETTGRLCNVLLDLYADLPDISGFDMILSSDAELSDEETGYAVRAVIASADKQTNADISRFFAGYSLCVTKVVELTAPESFPEPPSDMTADRFYEDLPRLMDELPAETVAGFSRYFEKQRRSELISEAVISGDIEGFFRLADQPDPDIPELATALHLSRRILSEDGASVAENGCILAFVPTYTSAAYAVKMGSCFGGCSIMNVGDSAAIEIV